MEEWVVGDGEGINSFQMPNVVADELMPLLKPEEFAVVLYLCRQTFGWDRPRKRVSAREIAEGQVTPEGRRLDWGTGMEPVVVVKQLLELQRFQVVRPAGPSGPDGAAEWAMAADMEAIDLDGLRARRERCRTRRQGGHWVN